MSNEMDSSRKLSRQELRARERAAKKNRPLDSLPELTAHEANYVVVNEARRLRIKPSKHEKALWGSQQRPLHDRPLPPNFKEAVITKVASTLGLMEQSKNPHFRQSAETIMSLVQDQSLSFDIRAHMTVPELETIAPDAEPGMATTVDEVHGSLRHFLIIPAKYALNRTTPLMLAQVLVHESTHLRQNQTSFDQQDPPMSPALFVDQHEDITKDLQTLLPREAEAYGEESDAIIYQSGLGQWLMEGDSIRNAAKFIQAGKNPQDPRWLQHIRKYSIPYVPQK